MICFWRHTPAMPISPAALIRDYTDLEIPYVKQKKGMRTCLPAKINVLRFVTGHPEYDAHTLAG